ncbi:MAG: Npt1/Npt2 family nucleotide transporter [Candidatus Latescibacterota bacterium]|nr:Npt1/Npt2 family nucleotide transporter [Candidatus Latescibacterota bacterium]
MKTSLTRPVAAALTMAVAGLFLLFSYEFSRSASVSLFLDAYGAEQLPVVLALGPVGTFVLIYLYGTALSRFGGRRTYALTTLLSGGAFVVGHEWLATGSALATGAIYVFREAYIVLLIEQLWAFIDSLLKQRQARSLNGLVCGIAGLGGVVGGMAVRSLATTVGTGNLLLVAAATLIPAAACGLIAYQIGGEPQREEGSESKSALGIELFRRHSALPRLAIIIVCTQVIAAVLELRFAGLLAAEYPETDLRTAYLGGFWSGVNIAAMTMQFVCVPLILRYASLRAVHLAIPVFHIATAVVLFVYPSLTTATIAFFAFKSVDYSIFRAAKEILYIPLPFDARYRAKEVIDALGYRVAKGSIAGALAVAGGLMGRLPGGLFPVLAMAAGLSWWGSARGLVSPQELEEG